MTTGSSGTAPARIFVAGEPVDGAVADTFAAIRARGGQPATMHRGLAAAPDILAAMYNMAIALRHRTAIERSIGELMILRTTQLEGGHYEFAAHRPIAVQVGLSQAKVDAVNDDWRGAVVFSSQERAVLAYADALAARDIVPDAVFADLHGHFDDRAIVELTITSGFYTCAARFSSGINMTVEH